MAGSILPLLGLYDRIYFMIVIFFRISITIRWSLGGIRLLHLVYADDPVGDIKRSRFPPQKVDLKKICILGYLYSVPT